jgi:hypothetical protein
MPCDDGAGSLHAFCGGDGCYRIDGGDSPNKPCGGG